MTSTRNDYCCVPQCKSWSKKAPSLSFHLFPVENQIKLYIETEHGRKLIDRRKIWINKLKIAKPVTKFMKVCRLHFTEYDFHGGGTGIRHKLKKTAVPSKNLPIVNSQAGSSTSVVSRRTRRYYERKKKKGKKKCEEDICFSDKSHSENEKIVALALLGLIKQIALEH